MEVSTINVNDVKKYLYKNKELMAKYIYYKHGELYYSVQLEDGAYKFPIETTEIDYITTENGEEQFLALSSDLGETPFDNEIKASLLNRWIAKAFEKGKFEKI
jgi:hypothetical protein